MPFSELDGLVDQLARGLAVGSNHRADVRKWERDDPPAGEWASQGAHWQIALQHAIAPTYLQPRYGVTVDRLDQVQPALVRIELVVARSVSRQRLTDPLHRNLQNRASCAYD